MTGSQINIDEEVSEPSDTFAEFPEELFDIGDPMEIACSEEVKATHEAEPDLFARHDGIPAHRQDLLEPARFLVIGGGGLGSWVAVCLARSGARSITIVDADRVDRTNLSRQFFYADDLGEPKGKRLARHIAAQAMAGAVVTGIGMTFEDALEKYTLPADLIIAGVDNNECRLHVVKEARKRGIPAIFSMLSRDGMRTQVFLQNASPLEPCLWCALPNLDPERIMPCASAIVSSCFMTAGFTVFFAHRAVMGWGELTPFNWREADLSGIAPDRIGTVKKRQGCEVCEGMI
ncbi:MAG: ThiF family adenylyltransferase [Chloracidobacterium sp.]|nr:ThiF family adenylyltransferase [Chloracidobacterium sp.]